MLRALYGLDTRRCRSRAWKAFIVSFESVRAECSQNNTDVKSDHSQDSKDGFIRQTGIPVLQTAHFSTKTASTNKAQCTISMADL